MRACSLSWKRGFPADEWVPRPGAKPAAYRHIRGVVASNLLSTAGTHLMPHSRVLQSTTGIDAGLGGRFPSVPPQALSLIRPLAHLSPPSQCVFDCLPHPTGLSAESFGAFYAWAGSRWRLHRSPRTLELKLGYHTSARTPGPGRAVPARLAFLARMSTRRPRTQTGCRWRYHQSHARRCSGSGIARGHLGRFLTARGTKQNLEPCPYPSRLLGSRPLASR